MKKHFIWTIVCFIHCLQLPAQTFLSISGTVNQGSSVTGNGILFAINRSNLTTKIDRIVNGSYTVDSILSGNYIVYALPDPANKSFIPTYFLSKQNPEQANSFDLVGLASGVNIFLIQKTMSETGSSILNLRFYYQNFTQDSGTDFGRKWFALPTPPSTISINGTPCQTLPVLLYNQQNQIVDWGVTDNEGYVQFKNLAGGTYYAVGQRYDYLTENGGSVFLTANATQNKSLWLTRNVATHIENTQQNNGSIIYPNPFKDELSISGLNEKDVTVTDLTGIIYYSNPTFGQITIMTTDWPKGIYLLTIGDKVHKVLKY